MTQNENRRESRIGCDIMKVKMMEKKLKDLKIGDRVWIYDFTDTTPITTIKKKREGELIKMG